MTAARPDPKPAYEREMSPTTLRRQAREPMIRPSSADKDAERDAEPRRHVKNSFPHQGRTLGSDPMNALGRATPSEAAAIIDPSV